MLRTIFSSVALIALMSVGASAEDYRHADNSFRMALPDGWVVVPAPVETVKVIAASPRAKETGGNCNVGSTGVEVTKSLTQDQIDQVLGAKIDETFWSDEMKSVASIKSFDIEKSGKRKQNGHNVYYSRITSVAVEDGQTMRVTQLQDMHAIPGELYLVTCTAMADQFSREEDDFTSIMASFELTATPVASLETAPPSLTLYAGAKFAGVSRVITQDTPNLGSYGWSKPASSVSVAGASAWEVCEGVDYAGRCRTIAGTATTLPDAGFTAGSVRRLNASPDRIATLAGISAARDALLAGVKSARRH